jgi:curved DNA-binding protein CbpA
MLHDHYHALGITPDATAAEVRAAYLRVMREAHPDRRPGDPAAEETSRAANAAWEVLRDSARRGSYDRLRHRRPDGTVGHAVTVVHTPQDAARIRAYRAEQTRVRAAFSASILKVFAAIVALGGLLLFTVS